MQLISAIPPLVALLLPQVMLVSASGLALLKWSELNTMNVCLSEGTVQCPGYQYCCPAGVACIPPNHCDQKCTPGDPLCGDGCCAKGESCYLNFYCRPAGSPVHTTWKTTFTIPGLTFSIPGVTFSIPGVTFSIPGVTSSRATVTISQTTETPTSVVPTLEVTTSDVPTTEVTTSDVPTTEVPTNGTGTGQDTSAIQTTGAVLTTTTTAETTKASKTSITSQTVATGAAAMATMGAFGMMVGLTGGFLLL